MNSLFYPAISSNSSNDFCCSVERCRLDARLALCTLFGWLRIYCHSRPRKTASCRALPRPHTPARPQTARTQRCCPLCWGPFRCSPKVWCCHPGCCVLKLLGGSKLWNLNVLHKYLI
jgi:hypothetical protein